MKSFTKRLLSLLLCALLAFGALALTANAAVTVTLDFCEGHEELASAFATSLNKQADGSRVAFQIEDAETGWDAQEQIGSELFRFLEGKDCIDNHEKLYSASWFAPRPMSQYENRSAMDEDSAAYFSMDLTGGETFCLLWLRPKTGGPVTLEMHDAPKCGTDIVIKNYGSIASNYTDPQPRYDIHNAEDADPWQASWYRTYDDENGTARNLAEGSVTGGETFYAGISIRMPFGYYLEDPIHNMSVIGADRVYFPTPYPYSSNTPVVVAVTAKHEADPYPVVTFDQADPNVVKYSYHCAACGALISEDVESPPVYHNVTIADDIQHGSLSVSDSRPLRKTKVTVTATPEDDRTILTRLYYTTDNGPQVEIAEEDGAYSFPMPDSDVTLHAVFEPKNVIRIHFGEYHKDFANQHFAGWGLTSGQEFTVNDGVVSFIYEPDNPSDDNALWAKNLFEDQQNSLIGYYDAVHYNQRYMFQTALHPLEYYEENYGEDARYMVDAEAEVLREMSVEKGLDLYALWAEPVIGATVTVTPPACGTVMTTHSREGTTQVEPAPEMTASGGLEFEDYMIFYNNWDIGLQNGETMTLTGGNSYKAYGYLKAPWGYFLPEDIGGRVSFRNATLTDWNSSSGYFSVSVPVSHSFDENGICTGCGAHGPKDRQSVTIDDQIALNLLLDLDTRGKTVDDVSISFDGKPYDTAGVKLTEGDNAGLYKFTVAMAPAQIAEVIAVTVGDETLPVTSVMNYCKRLCGPQYDEYEKEQALAKAILQYGKAANDLFDYSDAQIVTFDELDVSAVAAYTGARFSDGTGAVTGASFMALTKPEFRFYTAGVTEAEGSAYNKAGVSAAYKDSSVGEKLSARFVKKDANGEIKILIEVTGVSAENMDEEIVVTINGLGTITFNGNAFAKAMASSGDSANSVFGAALYNYGAAANACFRG